MGTDHVFQSSGTLKPWSVPISSSQDRFLPSLVILFSEFDFQQRGYQVTWTFIIHSLANTQLQGHRISQLKIGCQDTLQPWMRELVEPD